MDACSSSPETTVEFHGESVAGVKAADLLLWRDLATIFGAQRVGRGAVGQGFALATHGGQTGIGEAFNFFNLKADAVVRVAPASASDTCPG